MLSDYQIIAEMVEVAVGLEASVLLPEASSRAGPLSSSASSTRRACGSYSPSRPCNSPSARCSPGRSSRQTGIGLARPGIRIEFPSKLVSELAQALVHEIVQLLRSLVERSANLGHLFFYHRGSLSEPVQFNDHFLDS